MKKVLIIITGFLFIKTGIAQTITVDQYIQQNKDLAIREMKRMGIPAAITLAQGILETENGNSDLVKKSNNHFGIKCKNSWTATGVSHDDDSQGECFRCYKNAEDSYRDHSNFLRGSDRYSFLFKLDPRDYKGWAYGLKKAGYATNPHYPAILIKNIEDNNLQQYTMEAVKDVPFYDASKYTSDPEEKAYNDLVKTTAGNAAKTTGDDPFSNDVAEQFENKIMINSCAAVNAKKGTSLLAIATDNNINLEKLLEYNDLDKDGLLDKSQIIFLEKKQKEGEKDFYILQRGETEYDAAQKNGVRLQNLYEYNPLLKNDTPVAGTKIYLKANGNEDLALNEKADTAGDISEKINATTERPVSTNAKMHEVQAKEGLYSISKKYGVTVTQIKEWNNLPDDNLKIGQQLIISASK